MNKTYPEVHFDQLSDFNMPLSKLIPLLQRMQKVYGIHAIVRTNAGHNNVSSMVTPTMAPVVHCKVCKMKTRVKLDGTLSNHNQRVDQIHWQRCAGSGVKA